MPICRFGLLQQLGEWRRARTGVDRDAEGGCGMDNDCDDLVASLRRGIADIEAKGSVDTRAAAAARLARKRPPKPDPTVQRPYPGMPEGEDWLDHVPAQYRHGEGGFDRQLMEDVAETGYRCYRVDQIYVRSAPKLLPVALDWLEHLEERIPGPETRHRELIRGWLIWLLNDPAARGSSRAIAVVIGQILRRDPALPSPFAAAAGQVLARIATGHEFAQIRDVFHRLPDDHHAKPLLIAYFGKVKSAESRDVILPYLRGWPVLVIPALIKMQASEVRHLIEPFLTDRSPETRRYARRAMDRLT